MKDLSRFLRYLRVYKEPVALAVLLVLAASLLSLVHPLIVKFMLDRALPRHDWHLQKLLMLLFLLSFLLRGGLSYFNRYLLQKVGHRITCDLRKDIFAHLQTLSIKYYEKTHTGKIVARVTEDTGALFNLVAGVLVNLISQSVTFVGVVAMLFWLNGQLAALMMLVLPLFLLNYRFSQQILRKLSRRHRRNWDRVVGFLHERVASARLVKSFSMEKREIERFDRGIETDFRNFNQLALFNARLWVVADMISSLGMLIVLSYGGWLVIQGRMTIGNLVAFMTYIGSLFGPIVWFNDINSIVDRARTSLEKIFEIFDTPSFPSEKPGALELLSIQGRVEFRNVQFSYEATSKVLRDINLVAEPGQMIALVGPSGSGKTTMANLLGRFYDVDQGSILVDGHDLREVTLPSLRRQMGVVMQESVLFSGTLLENIGYSQPDAKREAVIAAAKAANAHEFIMQLPRDYFTMVGERGVKLSGGQRQRIAIARAIFKNPRILIFDEATSALDTESERMIQEAMERFMRDRTTFVIAHRLSTILRADRIIVIQNGAIVESGAHDELLARKGIYFNLYNLQFNQSPSTNS